VRYRVHVKVLDRFLRQQVAQMVERATTRVCAVCHKRLPRSLVTITPLETGSCYRAYICALCDRDQAARDEVKWARRWVFMAPEVRASYPATAAPSIEAQQAAAEWWSKVPPAAPYDPHVGKLQCPECGEWYWLRVFKGEGHWWGDVCNWCRRKHEEAAGVFRNKQGTIIPKHEWYFDPTKGNP